MPPQQDYTSKYKPTWCPGCGNFSIFPATKKALADLGIEPHQVAMIFGIGCSSNGSNFYHLYSFHGIHGRSLPVAMGVKMANHQLTIIADAGDGDAYGEGLNHLLHTARSNIDLTYLVHDNHLYSLTQGQMSPTTQKGTRTKSTPFGSLLTPINPLATALVSGATFVAQGWSGDILHLTELIKKAITHKGFALINILQLCPTFNKINTFDWYKLKIYKLEEAGHQPGDLGKAMVIAMNQNGRLPLGVLYQKSEQTYNEELEQIATLPLVKQDISSVSIEESLKNYQ